MTEKISRKPVWGWMLYDWAAQPFHTLLVTFIFAPYFTTVVVGDPVMGQAMWGYMMGLVGITIAILAPILGAVADSTGPRKPWMMVFSLLFIAGSFALWWAVPAMDNVTFILMAFAIGFVGVEFSQIFVNAFLPDLGTREELGRISGSGWAFGYLGGVIALFFVLLLLAEDGSGKTLLGISPILGLDTAAREGTRSVGPFTALWYFLFIIPFFLWVPDVKKQTRIAGAISKGLVELWHTILALPRNQSLLAYLASSMFYRDALNGLFAFGGIYASGVLGWTIVQIGTFGIIAAISGAVFTYLGGFADQRFGPKPVIIFSIFILIGVCLVVVGTSRSSVYGIPLAPDSGFPDISFMICGALIGAAGGVLQAASRTMLVHQANEERMTEAFGLYALSGRATAFLAPTAIAIATQISGNQRLGITPVIFLFIIGLILLLWVKTEQE